MRDEQPIPEMMAASSRRTPSTDSALVIELSTE